MDTSDHKLTIRSISFRIGGLLALASFMQGVDRLNVSYAGIALSKDLAFSASVFGFGAGIFFISYTAFGIPSNLALLRFGPRRWLTFTMVVWGTASILMAAVRGPTTFYLFRFVLGAAEGGYAPTMIYLVGQWFPSKYRGRMLSLLLGMGPVAAIVGAPISGLLLSAQGIFGLRGWQWIFVAEGIPTVLLAIVMLRWMRDSPDKAEWLSEQEKDWLASELDSRTQIKAERRRVDWSVLLRREVLALGAMLFSLATLAFALIFFLPQILKTFGFGDVKAVVMSSLPPTCGILLMTIWSRSSDRTGERLWHSIGALSLAVAGTVLVATSQSALIGIAALCAALAGAYAAQPIIWTYAHRLLRGPSSAMGIALIHSLANLAGFVGPTMMGLSKDWSGTYRLGMLAAASLTTCGAIMLFWIASAVEKATARDFSRQDR